MSSFSVCYGHLLKRWTFLGVIWLFLVDVMQIVLKDDVSDVVVIFDEEIHPELRWIFDSTTSDDLSCKCDMEEIVLQNNH